MALTRPVNAAREPSCAAPVNLQVRTHSSWAGSPAIFARVCSVAYEFRTLDSRFYRLTRLICVSAFAVAISPICTLLYANLILLC